MAITVDYELCNGCGRCIKVCPYGGIELKEGKAVLTATSMACRSSGLMMLSTPSLMRVPVFGSILISVVSGTCFMRTMMFIWRYLMIQFVKMRSRNLWPPSLLGGS